MISRALWRSSPALVSADHITPHDTMTRRDEMSQRSGSASSARRIGLAKASPTIDIELIRSRSTVSSSSTGSKRRPSSVTTLPPTIRLDMALNSPVPCISGAGRQVARSGLDDALGGARRGPARAAGACGWRRRGRRRGRPGATSRPWACRSSRRCRAAEVVAASRPHGPATRALGGGGRPPPRTAIAHVRAGAAAVVDPQPRADARQAVADLVDAVGERAVEDDGDDVGVVPQVDQLVVGVAVVRVHRWPARP